MDFTPENGHCGRRRVKMIMLLCGLDRFDICRNIASVMKIKRKRRRGLDRLRHRQIIFQSLQLRGKTDIGKDLTSSGFTLQIFLKI